MVAPLPNALFSHCGSEEFSPDYGEGSGPIDLGRFITAFIVVTGFSLPLVLAHSEIIKPGASVMSLIGGGYVIRLLPGFLLVMIAYSTPHAASYMGLFWRMLRLLSKTILNSSDPYSCRCIISYVISLNSIYGLSCAPRFDSIHVPKERNDYRGLSSPTVAFSVADPTFTTRAAALIARASTWTQNRPQATKHNGVSNSRSALGSRRPIGIPDVAPSCIA